MKNPMTFKKMLDEYLSYRKECGLATYPTVQLVVFYHHTIRKWPEDSYLTQQMVDWWAQKGKVKTLGIVPVHAFFH